MDLADLHRLKLIDLKLKIREHLFYPLNPRPSSRSIFLTSFLIFVKNKMPLSNL